MTTMTDLAPSRSRRTAGPRTSWPEGKFVEFVRGIAEGREVVATLGSQREAILFRQALYNYYRRHKLTLDGMMVVNKNQVIVFRSAPKIEIT